MIFKRNIKQNLEMALSRSPVVLLTGARQTGKTTLMKELGKEKGYHYITFDDLTMLSAAQSDPQGFISNLPKPVILDEVQRVPDIFLPIKKEVDANRQPGLFALTGSANPLLVPQIGKALVGRIELLELYPLSQGEIRGIKETFIDSIFNNTPLPLLPKLNRNDLYSQIITGGYPLVQNIDFEAKEEWFNSYTTTILYREINDLTQITNLFEFPRLLKLLATRVGNLLNIAELSRTIAIPTTTLHRYMATLQSIFILNLQQPWSGNLGKRIVKSPKISLIDSGLVTFLLNMNIEAFTNPIFPVGNLLEDFIVNELRKQATWNKVKVNLYHFRTLSGIEVDIILENRAGDIVGIEVKHKDTLSSNDFKGLKYLQESMDHKFIQGIVLYTGSEIVPFGNKLKAVPINALYNIISNK